MTVGGVGKRAGRLLTLASEDRDGSEADGRIVSFNHQIGKIFANLQIGADVPSAKPLVANLGLVTPGVIPHGEGMAIDEVTAIKINPYSELPNALLRSYCNGRELLAGSLNRYIIDAFPMSEDELKSDAPAIFQ